MIGGLSLLERTLCALRNCPVAGGPDRAMRFSRSAAGRWLAGMIVALTCVVSAALEAADFRITAGTPHRLEATAGAWAAFQAFLALYELTREPRYLDWTEHAMDLTLTYTVLWDIDLPAGRLRDHGLKTRGWTIVSAQNQHLDVYGVMFTPDIWRMGGHLGRDDLKRLAAVMYRTCGQMLDPYGSSGEQVQQPNFAQHGDMSNGFHLRGSYSENWTIFWITALEPPHRHPGGGVGGPRWPTRARLQQAIPHPADAFRTTVGHPGRTINNLWVNPDP